MKEKIAILKLFEAASNDFQADFETVGNVIHDIEVLLNTMNSNSDLCTTKLLEYWKSNQCRFSIPNEIGGDVVNFAASSGSVERAFSVASDILTEKRPTINQFFSST